MKPEPKMNKSLRDRWIDKIKAEPSLSKILYKLEAQKSQWGGGKFYSCPVSNNNHVERLKSSKSRSELLLLFYIYNMQPEKFFVPFIIVHKLKTRGATRFQSCTTIL